MRAMYSVGFIVSGSALFLIIGILVFGSREILHAPHQVASQQLSHPVLHKSHTRISCPKCIL